MHKKYTVKGGKRYGPYFYETKRIGDKIITHYVGKTSRSLTFLYGISFMLLVVLMVLLFPFNHPTPFTGHVVNNGDLLETDVLNQVVSSVSEKNATSVAPGSEIEVNVATAQYGAVLGQPVRWVKRVSLSDSALLSVEIPASADNITVINATFDPNLTVSSDNNASIIFSNETNSSTNETAPDTNQTDTGEDNSTLVGDPNEPTPDSPNISVSLTGTVVRKPLSSPWYSRVLGSVVADEVVANAVDRHNAGNIVLLIKFSLYDSFKSIVPS